MRMDRGESDMGWRTMLDAPSAEYRDGLKNKKLLIICPSYPDRESLFIGGTFVKYQLDTIKRYFKEVAVIAPVLSTFGLLKKDRLCADYAYDNVRVFFPRCHYIPLTWSKYFLMDDRLNAVEKTIREKRISFDLIHAHFTWPSAYIGARLKKIYDRPMVTTVHENGSMLEQELNLGNPLLRYSWENSDMLIRVNKKDVALLKQYNKNVYSIPNGYPPSLKPMGMATAREKLSQPGDRKIVFSLGMLIRRKGYGDLIDAMEAVVKKRDDVLCVIGGEGPERKKLQKRIIDKGLADHVKLIGFVPDGLLIYWMNACDIFVLPSLNEGNPVVMFEALGCGRPFIGTGVGGVPEVITSDSYGLLAKPADPAGLAEKILLALDREWDNGAIAEYSEAFKWENIGQGVIDLYVKVLYGQ